VSPPDPRRPSPRPRRRARPDPASAGRLARELADSDPLLTGLLAAAMDAVVVVDEEQRIVLFNAGAERMFEAKASEVLGQPLGRFLPERFRAVHSQQLARFARGGITSRRMGALGRVWGLRAGGEEFPAEASISQAEVGGHKPSRRSCATSRSARAPRRRCGAGADPRPGARVVVALDLEGTVVFWNQAAERLFEVPREEALGRTMERILASTNIPPGVVAEVIAAVRASGRHEAENEFVSASGRLGYQHTSCSLLRDAAGQPAGVIAVTQDTTDRRRTLEARLDAELRARRAGELAEIATLTAGSRTTSGRR
jgi:PAS domain S-box-containing protein